MTVGRKELNKEGNPLSIIPESSIDSILKSTYDAVFFFDVPNDVLICQHITEPLMTDIFNVRMVLADALGYWLNNLVDEADKDAAEFFIKQNVYGNTCFGTTLTFNFRAHTKEGESYYYTSSLYALGNKKFLFCCKDITTEKSAERLTQRNNELEGINADVEKYRIAVEYMDLAVIEWDFMSHIFTASPGYKRYAVSRYVPQLVGNNIAELSGVHEDDLHRFHEFCQHRCEEKTAAETIVRLKTRDGDYRWTRITVILYRNEVGEMIKAIGILHDVDDFVQTKAALSQSQKQFSQVINNILEGVVLFEMDGMVPRIQYISDNALRLYDIEEEKYQAELAAGKTPDEIIQRRLLSEKELKILLSEGEVSFSRSFDNNSLRYFEVICSIDRSVDPSLHYAIIHETTQEHENQARIEWQQEKYRMICQGSDIVTFDYDVNADELVYSFNLPPHGYREETVKSFLAEMEMMTLFREAQLREFKNYINAVLRGEEVDEFEILLNLHHHGFEWYAVQLFGIKDETGNIYRVIGKTQSIQKAKDDLMKRLRSDAVIQITLSSDALFSAAFSTKTGEKVSITGEVIPEHIKNAKNISQVFEHLKTNIHTDDMAMLMTKIFELNLPTSTDTTRKQKYDCRFHTHDLPKGEYKWVQFIYMYAFNEVIDEFVLYFFVMDIDEEKKHMLRIIEQANLDHTTGFLTRSAFENYCESERENISLSKTVNALVVLEFGFDDETPGYESLQRTERTASALAELIRGWMRTEDRPARFSDKKFLICMHALDSHAVLRERIESLRNAISLFEQDRSGISVFVGVTNCCHDFENGYRTAYDQAEIALYQAKEGRNPQNVFYVNQEGQKREIVKPKHVYIRTFGFFEVFIDQRPIYFKTAKAKELLAILVDRRGGYLSTDEAISYLWENEPANKVTRSRYRKVALRLKETLEEHGIKDIIEVSEHRRRIVMKNVQCDLFDLIAGKEHAVTLFSGIYMQNYSWAEVTSAQLSKRYEAL